jgi:hypothetical protein
MFGKPEWFTRRKYTGWGLTPKTWQGWAYILVFAAPLILIPEATFLPGDMKVAAMLAWALIGCLDILDIMAKLKKDEREVQIEAIAERNSAWAMVAAIVIGIGYQVSSSIASKTMAVDPFLLAVLMAGLFAKAATNWYLEQKM